MEYEAGAICTPREGRALEGKQLELSESNYESLSITQ